MTTATASEHWTTPAYQHGAPLLMFAVPGVPQPQGSKTIRVTRTGAAVVRDAVKGLRPWRDAVTVAIRTAIRQGATPGDWPLIGPVRVELAFTMRKPQSAPKRRRIYPIVKPDIDKLARAVLDALTFGGAVGDDSQIVDLHAYKVYPSETPRALRVPGVVGVIYQVTS